MSDVLTKRIAANAVTACKLSDAGRKRRYVYTEFNRQPVLTATGGFGTPVATDRTNEFNFGDGLAGDYHTIGDQVAIGPLLSYTTGLLDIGGTQTAALGFEYVWGGGHPRNPFGITVAAASAVRQLVRVNATPTAVAGVAEFLVGFRKTEAFQADYNSYTDLAALILVGATVYVATALNNAAVVLTDTGLTVADATAAKFRVDVDPSGKALFFVNDALLGSGMGGNSIPAFTFDSGDILIPITRFIQATAPTLLTANVGEFGPSEELNQYKGR
jgi:hypothetical protein